MSLSFSKKGIFNIDNGITESFITLPDDSQWQLLLFHLVDNGNRLFTSSNCGYCNDFGLFSRLQWINNFQYDNKYEFYVIQDGAEHRWTQTNAPWTTTSVTDFTLISGTVRGGICKNSNYTALAITSTSPWWNACGCYTAYNGGTPGFGPNNSNGICTDYLALYVRIENKNAFFETNSGQCNSLYEY